MSTPKRIYVVTNSASSPTSQRLIRASNTAQALRHVANDTFDVVVASQDALVTLLGAGIQVETAGEPQEQQEAGE
ncbi:hypothetical protein CO610_07315 [Lysobacteraceae bacterium NML95-0200]|nr:hypothetical protein CO610_07315 [Xanthomonadaceae bacterium NML95-0200]